MKRLLFVQTSLSRVAERGYAMAALLVALSVMAVLLSVAMPVWKQMAQREKEEELIFRGQQYAHAIGVFERRHGPGTRPPTVDVLLEEHDLRKKYKDPITGDDFDVIRQGQAGTTQTGPGQKPPAGAVGGIIGVASKSKAQSIRVYNGRTHYNEWAFTYQPPTQAGPKPTPTPSPRR